MSSPSKRRQAVAKLQRKLYDPTNAHLFIGEAAARAFAKVQTEGQFFAEVRKAVKNRKESRRLQPYVSESNQPTDVIDLPRPEPDER